VLREIVVVLVLDRKPRCDDEDDDVSSVVAPGGTKGSGETRIVFSAVIENHGRPVSGRAFFV
jgi:hypothetical protein